MAARSIAAINRLTESEKREVYLRLVPPELLQHFNLSPFLVDKEGRDLFIIKGSPGDSSVELFLYHQHGFEDPVVYGHLSETVNGQIHVLLYIMNDPSAPRFNVDRMPDGAPTKFGTATRNLEAEQAALQAGLLPGQVRKGLKMLGNGRESFEVFARSLGQTVYFVEPLYYHNAIIFEHYGFAYQSGRTLMERIHSGFSPNGDLISKLDGSPFRVTQAGQSIRLRSWAIHDGILGEPFDHVTMYKTVGKTATVDTAPGLKW